MARAKGGGQERASRRTEETVDETTTKVAKAAGEAAVKEEVDTGKIDDLLDEIDNVLESNAEEFVKGYIQKGGE